MASPRYKAAAQTPPLTMAQLLIFFPAPSLRALLGPGGPVTLYRCIETLNVTQMSVIAAI
jgi:hypothetical protein